MQLVSSMLFQYPAHFCVKWHNVLRDCDTAEPLMLLWILEFGIWLSSTVYHHDLMVVMIMLHGKHWGQKLIPLQEYKTRPIHRL